VEIESVRIRNDGFGAEACIFDACDGSRRHRDCFSVRVRGFRGRQQAVDPKVGSLRALPPRRREAAAARFEAKACILLLDMTAMSPDEKRPNKAPEPTPMLGTSAAEQPLVPSTVVAHL
jgi:hypothetical protein